MLIVVTRETGQHDADATSSNKGGDNPIIVSFDVICWPSCNSILVENGSNTLRFCFQAIRENWNLKYSATYVLCLLKDSGVKPQETVGGSISVIASASPNRPPTNLLTILDTEPQTGIEVPISLLVFIFFYEY